MTDAERRRAEWGTGGSALRDQRTTPMARALPDLRDPVWKLGLEVARLVIDYVIGERSARRIAAALLVVALSACSACATAELAPELDGKLELGAAPASAVAPTGPSTAPPHRRVTYYLDERPVCKTAPENRDAAAAGFALWQELGVEVLEADGQPADAAARRDVASRRSASGAAGSAPPLWSPDGVHMTIRTGLSTLWWVSSIASHELGHVIVESGDHLAEEDWGVMNGRSPWPNGFTDADLGYLAEHRMTSP